MRLPTSPSPCTSLRPVAACMAVAALLAVASLDCPPASARSDLLAYRMVDRWPERQEADKGVLQEPTDLDVAADGRVYVADRGVGGVHVLAASGGFAAPFGVTGGYPAQLGAVGAVALGPVPGEPAGERVYVLDPATRRLVLYSQDGIWLDAWEEIDGAGVAASSDGRVYVLDSSTSQVAVLDAATGARRFAFGGRGMEDGLFTQFTDISVSADGRVAAVGDKRGLRVQLFDLATDEELASASPPPTARLRRSYDLLAARFNKGDDRCSGVRVHALGEDAVFVGAGEAACLIDGTSVTFAVSASANNGTVCRATVRLPFLRSDTEQYYALATYDPNSGACGSKRTDLETQPVVLRYDDQELRVVRTVWTAQSNDRSNSLMIGPERLSMPAEGVVFVQDRTQLLRFYSTDGTPLGTAARDSISGEESTETTFLMLAAAEGSSVVGEVYGSYVQMRRSAGDGPPMPGPGPRPRAGDAAGVAGALDVATDGAHGTQQEGPPAQAQMETGIGRFRTVQKVVQGQTVDVLEPVWKVTSAGTTGTRGRRSFDVPAIAYNPTTAELLTIRTETVESQRSADVVIARYTADGTSLPSWDVPDDGKVNPYTDLSVGPDGRVYLLDDLDDEVRVLAPDGTPLLQVSVAIDARAVAGGPPEAAGEPARTAGSVFVLREAGAVERYDDSGTITARFDGRPLSFSDPTTISDILVDSSGRVYAADAQSSLIGVFEPATDADALPMPDDGQCLFLGRKSAEPSTLALGEATQLTLDLEGTCAVYEAPTDIVVVAPFFGELVQGVDPSTTALANLLRLGARVDFGKHRMGLVTYYTGHTVDLAPTHDADAYEAAVRAVERYDPPNQDVKARLAGAMAAAARLFDDPGRRRVMVLLDALYCDPADERFAGQCTGYPPAEDTAEAIRAAGVTIVVVQGFAAANLATSDEDFVMDVASAHRRMVGYELPESLAVSVEVNDEVPANMTVDTASISAGGTWAPPRLMWSASDLDFDGAAWSVRLTPAQPGRWPTNGRAYADVVDGWGTALRIEFESPVVEVIGPTATPEPPTALPAPSATSTAVATAVPAHFRVALPWLANRACDPSKNRVDLVLALDVSNSMAGAKMQTARDAASALLDAADLSEDGNHAALVTFAHDARITQPLTGDRSLFDPRLTGLRHEAGTRLDQALHRALEALGGGTARGSAGRAVLIVSDGGQTEAADQALAVSRLALSRGIAVYTLAVASDADAALLESVAGASGRAFGVENAFRPEAVIGAIERDLAACP